MIVEPIALPVRVEEERTEIRHELLLLFYRVIDTNGKVIVGSNIKEHVDTIAAALNASVYPPLDGEASTRFTHLQCELQSVKAECGELAGSLRSLLTNPPSKIVGHIHRGPGPCGVQRAWDVLKKHDERTKT